VPNNERHTDSNAEVNKAQRHASYDGKK